MHQKQQKFVSAAALIALLFGIAQSLFPQAQDADTPPDDFVLRQLVPLSEFVTIAPIEGGSAVDRANTLPPDDLLHLSILFDRTKIPETSGPQFLKITTSIFNRDGSLYNKVTQYAFTFARQSSSGQDADKMKEYVNQIIPFGFVSRRKIDTVDVRLDSIPEWSTVTVEVTPDEEYTKYSRRLETHRTWYYRAKGSRFESSFFLGIPKVLYDTNRKDTMTYGNASAMLRFYLLDEETGERYPVNLGIGTFGVSTPIDVTAAGGGFALSLFFDMIELTRHLGIELTRKVNAGIEVTPFFPLQHQARLLVNARIGLSL